MLIRIILLLALISPVASQSIPQPVETFEELLNVIKQNDVPRFRNLLANGFDDDSNTIFPSSRSVLHEACFHGSDGIVAELLSREKTNLTITNSLGETPLHLACEGGTVGTVQLVIGKSIQKGSLTKLMEATTRDTAMTALFYTFKRQHSKTCFEIINLLALEGNVDVNAIDGNGMRPTFIAMKKKWMDVVNLLLRRGADGLALFEGRTIHHTAAELDVADSVFIRDFFDEFAEDNKGQVPACYAAAKGNLNFANALLAQNMSPISGTCILSNKTDGSVVTGSPLYVATANVKVEYVKLMLDSIVSEKLLQLKDSHESSPIHTIITATKNSEDVMAIQIIGSFSAKNNKMIEVRDMLGRTPFLLAIELDRLEIAKFLHDELGAKPDGHDVRGYSVMHLAGSTKAVMYLNKIMKSNSLFNVVTVSSRQLTRLHVAIIEKKPLKYINSLLINSDLNAVDAEYKQGIWHLAVENNNIQAISVLKTKKECSHALSLSDIDGRTPLLLAVAQGKKEAAQLLIASGAKVGTEVLTGTKDTALHIAALLNNDQLARLLLQDASNEDGALLLRLNAAEQTAMHVAVGHGSVAVVSVLIDHLSSRPALAVEVLQSTDAKKMAALHMAAFNCNSNITQRLISIITAETNKTLMGMKDDSGRTPFEIAVHHNCKSVVEVFLGSDLTRSFGAKSYGSVTSLQGLDSPLVKVLLASDRGVCSVNRVGVQLHQLVHFLTTPNNSSDIPLKIKNDLTAFESTCQFRQQSYVDAV